MSDLISTHYDDKYFDWQASMGEFGGWANQSKFAEYISSNSRVLDFGCGGGFLLRSMKCSKKVGVEINPSAVETARKNGSPRVKSPAAGFGFMAFASFSFLRAAVALVGPVHLRVRARCARHHPLSVPAYGAEHPMLYAPEAGKTNRIRTRRPICQDGCAQRAAQENHGRFDQPSTLQAPVLNCLAGSDL